jgi:hypothetical protein
VPAVYNPPNGGPVSGSNGGIWGSQISGVTYKVLQCPSDPSNTGDGLTADGSWGASSYMANWNAFCASSGDGTVDHGPWGDLGWYTPHKTFSTITDGLSNTVLFGEGYQNCDSAERIALYNGPTTVDNGNIPYHSLGLTGVLHPGGYSTGDPIQDEVNGMPNTFLFQVQPLPLPHAQCPTGRNCCNNWAGQTGHSVYMTTLADGSVRGIAATVSPQTWTYLMLPQDGKPLGSDY